MTLEKQAYCLGKLMVLGIIVLGVGCSGHLPRDEALVYLTPMRSWVVLNQPLTIPPGHTRRFLQRGQVMAGPFDQYYPHCNFEIRTLSDRKQTIVPDEFLVTRLQRGAEEVVMRVPIKLAALGAYSWSDYSLPLIAEYIHIYLESKHQPDVMRLTCHGAFDFMSDVEPPTPAEMIEALGGIVTLKGSRDDP